MTRLIQICLLLAALGGLLGQSTATAMVPAPIVTGSLHASMASMECMDMVDPSSPGKSPCRKMTLQCMAAMGCAPTAMIEPGEPRLPLLSVDRSRSALPLLAARLSGRTYGPEPDPPSFLI